MDGVAKESDRTEQLSLSYICKHVYVYIIITYILCIAYIIYKVNMYTGLMLF